MWVPASENKVEYEREKHTPLTSDLYRYAFVYTCTHRYTHTYFIQSQYMQSFLLKCFLPINLLNKICSLLFLNLFFNNKNSKNILILTSSSWANWVSCWRHYVLEGNATLRGACGSDSCPVFLLYFLSSSLPVFLSPSCFHRLWNITWIQNETTYYMFL